MSSSRTLVPHASKAVLITALALVVAGLTACSPGTPTAASTTAPTETPTAAAAQPADSSPTPPCPVDAGTLYTALQSGSGTYASISGVKVISCYQGYATVETISAGPHEFALFGYDAAALSWRRLGTVDTGLICAPHVPADVLPHLVDCSDRG
jgi:hypothetical protein